MMIIIMIFWEELQTLNTSLHQRGGSAWRIFCGHQSTHSHRWLTWQQPIQDVIMQRWEIFSRQIHECFKSWKFKLSDSCIWDLPWGEYKWGSNRNHCLQPQTFENYPNKHIRTKRRGFSKQRNWSTISLCQQNLLYRIVSNKYTPNWSGPFNLFLKNSSVYFDVLIYQCHNAILLCNSVSLETQIWLHNAFCPCSSLSFKICFRDAFKGLSKTRYLEISNNGLTYNSSSSKHSFFGLFKYLENLEQIDFSDNCLNLTGKNLDNV